MRGKIIRGMLVLFVLLCLDGRETRAEIAGDDALKNLQWTQVLEEPRNGGVVQSVCATEYYIITMENIADDPNTQDVISAYYRKKTDENGNPVTPYSLAKRVQNREWEHCNGMTYNPNTNEIYVALYTNTIEENRGSLYVMDPDTLEYKRTIKISDDYNILGIDYIEDSDQYVIQTNVDGGYSFKILNADFQVVEDLGEYDYTAEGNNFQDLAVSGDYILNFPLTLGLGIGDYIHMYSISRREMVAAEQLDFGFEGVTSDEPESLCELEPGFFLAVVNVEAEGQGSMVRLYETLVPYNLEFTPVKVNTDTDTDAEKGPEPELSDTEKEPELSETEKEPKQEPAETEQTTPRKAKAKLQIPVKKIMVVVVVILAVLIVVLIAYSYVLRIRRERKRKERERRRRRRMVAEAGRVGELDDYI